MGIHEYLNIHGYSHSGYPQGYEASTSIKFIQRSEDGYNTIRTHGYSLTSLHELDIFVYKNCFSLKL